MKRRLENVFASVMTVAFIGTVAALCCVQAPAVEGRTRCPHYPGGCCLHNLKVRVWWPVGYCTPVCLLRENQCDGRVVTPGGSVGVRFDKQNSQ